MGAFNADECDGRRDEVDEVDETGRERAALLLLLVLALLLMLLVWWLLLLLP